MPDNIHISPTDTFVKEFTFVQDVGAALVNAGTFDGTVCTAGNKQNTGDSINDRHHVVRLFDNFTDACIFEHLIDRRYITNSSIKVDVYWTCVNTGNAYLSAGLSQSGTDNILGNDTDTEYIAFATYNRAIQQIIKTTFTFNAALHGGIAPNAATCFILMRKGADALDTLNEEFKILGVNWRYNIDKL